MMRNIKITISYDGTNYSGWQRQKNSIGVQNVVEKAVSKITGQPILIHGSGRTDGGVHALGQVASFSGEFNIPVENIPLALNTHLRDDIVVLKAEEMEEDFHARYSSIGKSYIYKIYNSKYRNPIVKDYTYHVKKNLDIEAMIEASRYLLGEHDFRSFMSQGSNVKTTVRRIDEITIGKNNDDGIVSLYFRGNGFLYNMVRIIVGTLIQVGHGKRQPEEMERILNAFDRTKAGPKSGPAGLFLNEVYY